MKLMGKILAAIVIITLLVLVRAFEDNLFYDPLLAFFKGEYKYLPLPALDVSALLLHTSLRFAINSVLSILLLWVIFGRKETVVLCAILYAILFVVLIVAFAAIVIWSEGTHTHFLLFYIRRFLIQPLLLLVLLPAFYYQKIKGQ